MIDTARIDVLLATLNSADVGSLDAIAEKEKALAEGWNHTGIHHCLVFYLSVSLHQKRRFRISFINDLCLPDDFFTGSSLLFFIDRKLSIPVHHQQEWLNITIDFV